MKTYINRYVFDVKKKLHVNFYKNIFIQLIFFLIINSLIKKSFYEIKNSRGYNFYDIILRAIKFVIINFQLINFIHVMKINIIKMIQLF